MLWVSDNLRCWGKCRAGGSFAEGSEQRSGSSSKGSGQSSFAKVGAAFLVQWETRQVSQMSKIPNTVAEKNKGSWLREG